MSRVVKTWIPSAIALATCAVTLVGYLRPGLSVLTSHLVDWAVIVGAFALLLGLLNILRVHGRRVADSGAGWLKSLVLLLASLVTLAPPVLEILGLAPYEPSETPSTWFFNHIIAPSGASLAALLVVTLTLSLLRMVRTQLSLRVGLFLVVVVIVLLGSTPLVGVAQLPLLAIRDWLVRVPGMAGTRGLLIGVVLGTLMTAIRVILAIDRPHSEA